VRPELRPVLLLGAYQILWLESVPDFAAVDVAVNLAKERAGANGGRFVNAVLRQLIRAIATYRAPLAEADSRRTIPIRQDQGCVLDRDVFADPDRDFANWLADCASHPCALVSRWIHTYGREGAQQICMAGLTPPPLVLRPNTLKTTPAGLRGCVRSSGTVPVSPRTSSTSDSGIDTATSNARRNGDCPFLPELLTHPLSGRDYFEIEDEHGRRLWVYRELRSNRWFVHGQW
jgi:16S rRNA (cytosine967-C5)-methyltransferase